jgi:hypothetical protein
MLDIKFRIKVGVTLNITSKMTLVVLICGGAIEPF